MMFGQYALLNTISPESEVMLDLLQNGGNLHWPYSVVNPKVSFHTHDDAVDQLYSA